MDIKYSFQSAGYRWHLHVKDWCDGSRGEQIEKQRLTTRNNFISSFDLFVPSEPSVESCIYLI